MRRRPKKSDAWIEVHDESGRVRCIVAADKLTGLGRLALRMATDAVVLLAHQSAEVPKVEIPNCKCAPRGAKGGA